MLTLLPSQQQVLEVMRSFVTESPAEILLLKGGAGTGKTTLVSYFIEAMLGKNLAVALMAPTGRAARILQQKVSNHLTPLGMDAEAATIHRSIYTFNRIEVYEDAADVNDPGMRLYFPLKIEESCHRVWLVDEASMVGNKDIKSDTVSFGSGRLLDDLLVAARIKRTGREFDGHTPKLIFVGDPAQLPPIGDESSPALDENYLRHEYGLNVEVIELSEVMRQAEDSQILARATEIRQSISQKQYTSFSLQPLGGDIRLIEAADVADLVLDGLNNKNMAVAISYTNKTALTYNRSIREKRWGSVDAPLQYKDLLLVNANNALFNMKNGDIVMVKSVDGPVESHTIRLRAKGGDSHEVQLMFRDVGVAMRDDLGHVIEKKIKIIENLLQSPSRELDPLEKRALLVDFRKRHPELNPKTETFQQAIARDPYFNAVQMKFGYAMTCHKSQGGEWQRVIVDFGDANIGANSSAFRWAYTAITRAQKQLFVINPPEFNPVSQMAWGPKAASSSPSLSANLGTNPQPDLTPLQQDPDWNRFGFYAGLEPIMAYHQSLRTTWQAKGIEIAKVEHLQYTTRYHLHQGEQQASIEYSYKGNFTIGRSRVICSTDNGLASAAIDTIEELKQEPQASEALAQAVQRQWPEFIQKFLAGLDQAITGTDINRSNVKHNQYFLRIGFNRQQICAEIDFFYNGKEQWTRAAEVGKPGSSQGIYQTLQALMQSQFKK